MQQDYNYEDKKINLGKNENRRKRVCLMRLSVIFVSLSSFLVLYFHLKFQVRKNLFSSTSRLLVEFSPMLSTEIPKHICWRPIQVLKYCSQDPQYMTVFTGITFITLLYISSRPVEFLFPVSSDTVLAQQNIILEGASHYLAMYYIKTSQKQIMNSTDRPGERIT